MKKLRLKERRGLVQVSTASQEFNEQILMEHLGCARPVETAGDGGVD
jgi:hypothetical protein